MLITLATLIAFAAQPGAAMAECANPPPLEDALRRAPIAFVGEVTSAGLNSDEATISVLWIWKGPDLPEQLVLQTPTTATLSGEAGFRFRPAATYIVFLENSAGSLEVGECSGTRRYRGDGQAIPPELQLIAGATAGRAPGVPSDDVVADGGAGWTYIAIGAAVGVLLLAWLARAYVRRRRSRPPKDLLKRRIPAVNGLLSTRRTSGDRHMQRLRRRKKN